MANYTGNNEEFKVVLLLLCGTYLLYKYASIVALNGVPNIHVIVTYMVCHGPICMLHITKMTCLCGNAKIICDQV